MASLSNPFLEYRTPIINPFLEYRPRVLPPPEPEMPDIELEPARTPLLSVTRAEPIPEVTPYPRPELEPGREPVLEKLIPAMRQAEYLQSPEGRRVTAIIEEQQRKRAVWPPSIPEATGLGAPEKKGLLTKAGETGLGVLSGTLQALDVPRRLVTKGVYGVDLTPDQIADIMGEEFPQSPFSPEALSFMWMAAHDPLVLSSLVEGGVRGTQAITRFAKTKGIPMTEKMAGNMAAFIREGEKSLARPMTEAGTSLEAGFAGRGRWTANDYFAYLIKHDKSKKEATAEVQKLFPKVSKETFMKPYAPPQEMAQAELGIKAKPPAPKLTPEQQEINLLETRLQTTGKALPKSEGLTEQQYLAELRIMTAPTKEAKATAEMFKAGKEVNEYARTKLITDIQKAKDLHLEILQSGEPIGFRGGAKAQFGIINQKNIVLDALKGNKDKFGDAQRILARWINRHEGWLQKEGRKPLEYTWDKKWINIYKEAQKFLQGKETMWHIDFYAQATPEVKAIPAGIPGKEELSGLADKSIVGMGTKRGLATDIQLSKLTGQGVSALDNFYRTYKQLPTAKQLRDFEKGIKEFVFPPKSIDDKLREAWEINAATTKGYFGDRMWGVPEKHAKSIYEKQELKNTNLYRIKNQMLKDLIDEMPEHPEITWGKQHDIVYFDSLTEGQFSFHTTIDLSKVPEYKGKWIGFPRRGPFERSKELEERVRELEETGSFPGKPEAKAIPKELPPTVPPVTPPEGRLMMGAEAKPEIVPSQISPIRKTEFKSTLELDEELKKVDAEINRLAKEQIDIIKTDDPHYGIIEAIQERGGIRPDWNPKAQKWMTETEWRRIPEYLRTPEKVLSETTPLTIKTGIPADEIADELVRANVIQPTTDIYEYFRAYPVKKLTKADILSEGAERVKSVYPSLVKHQERLEALKGIGLEKPVVMELTKPTIPQPISIETLKSIGNKAAEGLTKLTSENLLGEAKRYVEKGAMRTIGENIVKGTLKTAETTAFPQVFSNVMEMMGETSGSIIQTWSGYGKTMLRLLRQAKKDEIAQLVPQAIKFLRDNSELQNMYVRWGIMKESGRILPVDLLKRIENELGSFIRRTPELRRVFRTDKQRMALIREAQAAFKTEPASGRAWAEITTNKFVAKQSALSKEFDNLITQISTRHGETMWDKIKGWFRSVDDPRRGLLVPQLATTSRNAIGQAGIYTARIFADAIHGVGQSLFKGEPIGKAFRPLTEDIFAIARRLNSAQRKNLKQILSAFPDEQARLFQTFSGDVPVGRKIVDTINVLNKGQEFFFRNLIFDAEINRWAMSAGKDLMKTPSLAIPLDVIKGAVTEALKGTVAYRFPRGTLGGAVLDIYDKMPMLTLVNAFPRYMMNAYNFLFEYSPAGFIRLLSPSVRKSDKVISKAIIGTGFLSAGLAIRLSPLAGEKWYELQIGDTTYDMHPFGPFNAYLFAAELMKAAGGGKTSLSGKDLVEGLLSVRPLAGTALTFFDLVTGRLDSKNAVDRTVKSLKRAIGEYVGSFTVPFRTLGDLIGQISPQEAITRRVTEYPLTGPTLKNIPFAGRVLPPSPRITREEPYKTEYPAMRQLTGLRGYTKTPLEREIDRLELKDIYPRLADPKYGRYIAEEMGKIMGQTKVGDEFVTAEWYKGLPDEAKELIIKDVYSAVRKIATENALMRLIQEGASLEDLEKLLISTKDRELIEAMTIPKLSGQKQAPTGKMANPFLEHRKAVENPFLEYRKSVKEKNPFLEYRKAVGQ